MTYLRHIGYLRRNWFWAALLLVVVLGYQFGKDRAMRDNEVAAGTVGQGGDRG